MSSLSLSLLDIEIKRRREDQQRFAEEYPDDADRQQIDSILRRIQ